MNKIIAIPKELKDFPQLSEVAQILKETWKLKIIDSLTNPDIFTLSETGKAKVFIQGKRNDKSCYPINFYCEHTERKMKKCDCPLRTPEILLERLKKDGNDINKLVQVNEAKYYPYKWVINEIEKNLYSLSLLNHDIKILSFSYFASDVDFEIKQIDLSKDLCKEGVKSYISDWLKKEKQRIRNRIKN